MEWVSLVPALKGITTPLVPCCFYFQCRHSIEHGKSRKGFVLMKKFFALIALVCCAAPATANDNLLSSLGLAGLEEVTVQEASEVAGRGFVYATVLPRPAPALPISAPLATWPLGKSWNFRA